MNFATVFYLRALHVTETHWRHCYSLCVILSHRQSQFQHVDWHLEQFCPLYGLPEHTRALIDALWTYTSSLTGFICMVVHGHQWNYHDSLWLGQGLLSPAKSVTYIQGFIDDNTNVFSTMPAWKIDTLNTRALKYTNTIEASELRQYFPAHSARTLCVEVSGRQTLQPSNEVMPRLTFEQ